METMNLDAFDPNTQALTKMAAESKDLVITGIEDVEGYKRVHEARIELKKARVSITKKGKELREEAVAFQKAVIQKEKDLIAIIEPVEDILSKREEAIDELKEQEKRRALLPERHEKLKEIEVEVSDYVLLEMSPEQFQEFFIVQKEAWLKAKEDKMRQEAEKLEAEKQAILRKEQEEKRRVEEERLQLEREARHKQELEAAAERARVAEQERQQREQAELERAKKEEEKALLRDRKVKAFLKEHGWSRETEKEFIVRTTSDKIELFKKVGEFKE